MKYFLGGDVGATKTHLLIADENGRATGLGEAGPGNHENIGWDGFRATMQTAYDQAIAAAGIDPAQIAGAGFGIGGYDWPHEREPHMRELTAVGVRPPVEIVNDALLGLLAGSSDGWGVGVVSGTGCNCWGWDRDRKREGRVTGHGVRMDEGAGASELTYKAMQAVSHAWTRRGPQTSLTEAFIRYTGASDFTDLVEGYAVQRYAVDAPAARLVFQAAEAGDRVACDLIHWAGVELGEMVNAVARQLEFGGAPFEVIMIGSMFRNGAILIDPMRETIHKSFPAAVLVPLATRPVVGAVLLGMEAGGVRPAPEVRQALIKSVEQVRKQAV